jgi:hypothetical protein
MLKCKFEDVLNDRFKIKVFSNPGSVSGSSSESGSFAALNETIGNGRGIALLLLPILLQEKKP